MSPLCLTVDGRAVDLAASAVQQVMTSGCKPKRSPGRSKEAKTPGVNTEQLSSQKVEGFKPLSPCQRCVTMSVGSAAVLVVVYYRNDINKIDRLPHIGRIMISMYGADFNSQIMVPWFSGAAALVWSLTRVHHRLSCPSLFCGSKFRGSIRLYSGETAATTCRFSRCG